MTQVLPASFRLEARLPRMVVEEGVPYPEGPADLSATGVDELVLRDLALKLAYTVPQFSTEWAARQLKLPIPIVEGILQQLHRDKLLEILGPSGPACYRYAITDRGCDRAGRLMEVSAYVGPAPVSLAAYTQVLEWQLERRPPVSPRSVVEGLTGLVLESNDLEVIGLAVSSGRSLFLYGPSGNGKTSVGQMVHSTVKGDLWIPHCIHIESHIIQVFDPQCHQLSTELPGQLAPVDDRWVRIRPPLVVVGGELTVKQLDLVYSQALRFYQAPLHLKANGGIYMIDDFGRQRVEPNIILNRWIMPLENRIDYLTLRTGQQIPVPFRQMLIIATNLDPDVVMDNSFLRRMGYRLRLGSPSLERFTRIFEEYAARNEVPARPELIARLLQRYRDEKRTIQACEARDLIERARDICKFRERPFELSDEVMDLAWTSYFGRKDAEARR